MDDRLQLAEHYYAVAAHMKQQGEYYTRVAVCGAWRQT